MAAARRAVASIPLAVSVVKNSTWTGKGVAKKPQQGLAQGGKIGDGKAAADGGRRENSS
jgi:hypothetical protein